MSTTIAAAVWLLLITVMFGGEALLRLLIKGGILTPHKETWFRAGHAHGGTLLVMVLVYLTFMERTHFGATAQTAWSVVALIGALAVAGGFFLHMGRGLPHRASRGTRVTVMGSIALAAACLALIYGLVTA